MSGRLRLFLLWLLMAAAPLQGFAAASVLFCAPATDNSESPSQANPPALHDHSKRTHTADSVADGADRHDCATEQSAQCSLCAACCHSVAITQPAPLKTPVAQPQSDIADPLVRIVSQPSSIPDKPPRA